MAVLLTPDLNRVAYRTHLVRLYGTVTSLEAGLWAEPGWHLLLGDTADRRKTPWLVQDLADLGVHDVAVLPCDAIRTPDTTAQALGVAYVLEGATLGGAIIGKHLRRSAGITPERGGRYYHSYGSERGPRWLHMQATLDRFGTVHPDAVEEVEQAAATTFAAMHAWMAASRVGSSRARRARAASHVGARA